MKNKKILNFYKNLPKGFVAKKRTMFGKNMVLITPADIKTKWTTELEMFRSCLFDGDTGEIYSLGFKKFVNFGENPDFQPWNHSWKIEARHKIDGSLLCISKVDGNILIRTRGVFDAREHETGDEIDGLIQKYKYLFDNIFINSENHTILCEHTTPKRIIVLRESEEPKLTLLGIINHQTLEYIPQFVLDSFAIIVEVDRPDKHEYNSLQECIADVSAWKGKEGVVLYSPDGQILKKIKADEYCELHKLATGIKTVNHVLDVFMQSPKFTNYEDFYKYIETLLDYEIAEKCKPFIQEITDAYATFVKCTNRMRERMVFIHEYANRKEQAEVILQEFREWKTVVAFLLLDKREIDDKVLRKSLEYILEI
jgi:hypothetical protein